MPEKREEKESYRLSKGDIIFLVVAMLLVGFIAGTNYTTINNKGFKTNNGIALSTSPSNAVTMKIAAVDSNGNGVTGNIITTVKHGTGQILINSQNVLSQVDTQLSARNAVKAASDITEADSQTIDVTFNIEVNANIIEGPSAGSTMAVAVALALQNKTTDGSIVLTGNINEDGTISSVGSIMEKARAAKQADAKLFLVPKEQSREFNLESEKGCQNIKGMRYCRLQYNQQEVNIGQAIGIEVKEVANLKEAMGYF